jgi:hypothetical protein
MSSVASAQRCCFGGWSSRATTVSAKKRCPARLDVPHLSARSSRALRWTRWRKRCRLAPLHRRTRRSPSPIRAISRVQRQRCVHRPAACLAISLFRLCAHPPRAGGARQTAGCEISSWTELCSSPTAPCDLPLLALTFTQSFLNTFLVALNPRNTIPLMYSKTIAKEHAGAGSRARDRCSVRGAPLNRPQRNHS